MDDRRLDRLAAAVRGIEGANAAVQEEWFIDPLRAGRPGEGILARARRSVAGASEAAMDAIFGGRRGSGYVTAFSEAALMFGSLSPRIGDADVAAVAKVLIDSFDPRGEAAALSRLVRDEPLSPTRRAHEEGQDLALDLLDDLGLPRSADSSIDVDAILSTLQIHLLRLDLNDSNIRGLAIAGQQNRPTIVVNTAHFMNQRAEGERFTIAHELCHVLHDRGYGRRVSLASGPWAPASVERRANAFAAMLLMPPEIVRRATAAASKPVETLGGATEVARRMQTGLRATIEHLGNLGEVGEADREHLLFELDGLMEQRAN